MNDGTNKRIADVLIGDILENNNSVTAKIIVEKEGSTMYNLNNIIVSDSHIVKFNESWIPVSTHPEAVRLEDYGEKYLYCLNTQNKEIRVSSHTFTDWDEIYGADINEVIQSLDNANKFSGSDGRANIHKYLDGGFANSTRIKLYNGDYKDINAVNIGDKLANGEKVYGVVEIDGSNVVEQYKVNLGGNFNVEGGPTMHMCEKLDWSSGKIVITNKHKNLYHLLTDKKTFYIENKRFYDYNASIDLCLEKHRGKLLSMKYV
jgi:hypothetical protein